MRPLISLLIALPGVLTAQDLKGPEKALAQALKEQNLKGTETAVAALLSAGSPDAMKILTAAVAKSAPDHKKTKDLDESAASDCLLTVLNAAASFQDPAALAVFADSIVSQKNRHFARDAMAAACNHAHKGLLPLCFKVLEGGSDDLKLMALDPILSHGDKTSVELLIKSMKASEKGSEGVLIRIGRALTSFTGQDYGGSITNWTGWWDNNKDKDWEVKAVSGGGSTGTVTDSLDRSRMTEVELLKKTAKVLVLGAGTGCKCKKDHDLDHIEKVTEQMGLQTTVVNKTEFEKMDDAQLNGFIAILGNCTHIREHCICPLCKPGDVGADRLYKCVCPKNEHESARYVLSEKACQKIRKYVEGGGYLFAEDWAMEDYVQKAFSEFVIIGSVRPKDEIVSVVPKAGSSSHPYLKKIFTAALREREKGATVTADDLDKISHSWKIDKETRTVHIRDPRVVTLLCSPELHKTAKGDDAVAITFGVMPGTASAGGAPKKNAPVATGGELSHNRKAMSGGRVVYVLSHFGKQGASSDEHSLQNLLINFLIEANDRRASR